MPGTAGTAGTAAHGRLPSAEPLFILAMYQAFEYGDDFAGERSGVPAGSGDADMTVERSHVGHETRYELQDGPAMRCVLAFDAGEEGSGPAAWKILLPGPGGTEDLYGTHDWLEPDAARLTAWLTPIVGSAAATELAAAVDANPPPSAGWRR